MAFPKGRKGNRELNLEESSSKGSFLKFYLYAPVHLNLFSIGFVPDISSSQQNPPTCKIHHQ